MTSCAFALLTAAWTALSAAAPDAPSGVIATPGDAQAQISWTAPADNGSAITDYTATATPGPVTCAATAPAVSCTLTGLTNEVAYSVTVTATNGDGTSVDSSPAVMVTPHGPPVISPLTPSRPPRGTVAFVASAGSATGYVWSLTAAPSGGTIDATTGAYQAGPTPNVTDTVRLQDSIGGFSTTTVAITAGVSISPPTLSVAPRGTRTFAASGGSGTGYVWSFASPAPSGGTINSGTGAYQAGSTPNTTDTVRVQDSLGNVATVSVTVGAGVSISPPTPAAAPLGGVSFVASGGSGSSYSWSLTAAPSGGTINATTGAYHAGPTPGVVDTVRVQDPLGNFAVVNVSVGAGLAVNPASPTVIPGAQQQFTATGGSGTGFTWSISPNNSAGSISSSGLYTAGRTGEVSDTVIATDPLGNHGSVTVQVSGGLKIAVGASEIRSLDRVQLSVTGGSGTGYVWALTLDGTGASIDANGLYTAGRRAGTDVVTVTDSLGNQATVALQVEQAGQVQVGGGGSGCASVPGRALSALVMAVALRFLFRRRPDVVR